MAAFSTGKRSSRQIGWETKGDPIRVSSGMETNTDLEQVIGRVLETGIGIPDDTLFFAESTYGITGRMLASALRDSSFEGKEPLTELIFTPGSDVRSAVEPRLPVNAMNDADIEDLAAALARRFEAVDLVLASDSSRCTVAVDRETIALLLQKLYLDRAIDEKVLAALGQTFSSATVIAARVMMRCRGDVFGERKREFVCRFVKRSKSYENRFVELLGLVLTLLAEIADERPIEAYFLQKKRALVNKLKEIRIFTEKRDHYSMEYLMMQRFRIPHESEEEVLSRLFLLTTVTDVILGLPPEPAARAASMELGPMQTEKGRRSSKI